MSAHWEVGTEVECIATAGEFDGIPFPVLGAKYKIAEVLDTIVGVTLQFTTLHFAGNARYVPGFSDDCFRPVTKRPTSIAIFTALLTPTEDEIFREFEAAEFDYEDVQVPR